MKRMSLQMIIWLAVSLAGVACLTTAVGAAVLTSPNYKLNTNIGGTFGGNESSTSYKMSTVGGEAVVGNGTSGSYKLRQYFGGKTATSMSLAVQPHGLMAMYPFDENTGTIANDSTAYSNTGTLGGGATWGTGQLGSAVSLSGTSQSVTVPNSSAFNNPGSQMTLSVWVYQNTGAYAKAIASNWQFSGSNTVSGSWALQTGSSFGTELQFYVSAGAGDNGSNYVLTSKTFSAKKWHHIVVVYDGTQPAASRVKIYLDNSSLTLTTTGTIPATMQSNTAPLATGDFTGLSRYWNGLIDQVKIYSTAWTPDQVAADYNAENAGTPAGLSLGTLIGANSNSADLDTILKTNGQNYALAVNQNHNLQVGTSGATIPAVSGTIASPLTWTEKTTKGLGFSIVSAPQIDDKWGAGANYAAFPNASTTFYGRSGATNTTGDLVWLRTRADIVGSQTTGSYANTVTITGTDLP